MLLEGSFLKSSQLHFFGSKRFFPLFLTQFLGAFNDNLFKNALVILITYRLAEDSGFRPDIMVTLVAALFILPFFIFSSIAGQLADCCERSRIVRIIKWAEIGIMILAAISFYFKHINMLMFLLFLMGTHSAFFGPIKYALLPQHLKETELLKANAYVDAGTFIAILLGTILGGLLILQADGVFMVSAAMILVAALGAFASYKIPLALPPAPGLKLHYNIFLDGYRMLRLVAAIPSVFLAMMASAWFWLLGATYLSQFPSFVKNVMAGDETVVTLFLTVFTVGIALGSLFCGKISKGKISAKYVPYAALGMCLFGIDLYIACSNYSAVGSAELFTATQFISEQNSWRIVCDLFAIAFCGGIYIVPLYTIIQHHAPTLHKARIIAFCNVMNASFMVLSALFIIAMLMLHFGVVDIFLVISLSTGIVSLMLFSRLTKFY